MAYYVYANYPKQKSRLHDENYNYLHQKEGGKSNNDEEHYFLDYNDAGGYLGDYDDCKHCNDLFDLERVK